MSKQEADILEIKALRRMTGGTHQQLRECIAFARLQSEDFFSWVVACTKSKTLAVATRARGAERIKLFHRPCDEIELHMQYLWEVGLIVEEQKRRIG